MKKAEYAYRVYNDDAISRLRQIILLRKLRIPLKQIGEILTDYNVVTAIGVLSQNVNELNNEIMALSTIRTILNGFIDELQKKTSVKLNSVMFSDESVLHVIDSLSLTKINFKEERSMEEFDKANEALSKLKDVRILHLPPCTVAASHFIGENPELTAGNLLKEFIASSSLYQIKPDARVFGFNHPNPSQDRPDYGYEIWVTIPDGMEVPAPLQKKRFEGGLYAAHMIQMGNFQEWEWLVKWVNDSPKYKANYSDKGEEIMGGCLEEHLNFVYDTYKSNHKWSDGETQLDLLTPIQLK